MSHACISHVAHIRNYRMAETAHAIAPPLTYIHKSAVTPVYEADRTYTHTSHVTYTCESYSWVMSHTSCNNSVAHRIMSRTCATMKWLQLRMQLHIVSHKYIWVVACLVHTRAKSHIRISHGKHIRNHGMAEAARAESCHKFGWDMSHTHTNRITRMYASCHTHVWVNIAQPWNGRGRACGQHHCGKPLDAWAAGSRFAQAVTPQFAAAFLPVGVRSLVLCVQRCMWLYLICVTLLVV